MFTDTIAGALDDAACAKCATCKSRAVETVCDRCEASLCADCTLSDTDFAERGALHPNYDGSCYNFLCARCYSVCRCDKNADRPYLLSLACLLGVILLNYWAHAF